MESALDKTIEVSEPDSETDDQVALRQRFQALTGVSSQFTEQNQDLDRKIAMGKEMLQQQKMLATIQSTVAAPIGPSTASLSQAQNALKRRTEQVEAAKTKIADALVKKELAESKLQEVIDEREDQTEQLQELREQVTQHDEEKIKYEAEAKEKVGRLEEMQRQNNETAHEQEETIKELLAQKEQLKNIVEAQTAVVQQMSTQNMVIEPEEKEQVARVQKAVDNTNQLLDDAVKEEKKINEVSETVKDAIKNITSSVDKRSQESAVEKEGVTKQLADIQKEASETSEKEKKAVAVIAEVEAQNPTLVQEALQALIEREAEGMELFRLAIQAEGEADEEEEVDELKRLAAEGLIQATLNAQETNQMLDEIIPVPTTTDDQDRNDDEFQEAIVKDPVEYLEGLKEFADIAENAAVEAHRVGEQEASPEAQDATIGLVEQALLEVLMENGIDKVTAQKTVSVAIQPVDIPAAQKTDVRQSLEGLAKDLDGVMQQASKTTKHIRSQDIAMIDTEVKLMVKPLEEKHVVANGLDQLEGTKYSMLEEQLKETKENEQKANDAFALAEKELAELQKKDLSIDADLIVQTESKSYWTAVVEKHKRGSGHTQPNDRRKNRSADGATRVMGTQNIGRGYRDVKKGAENVETPTEKPR